MMDFIGNEANINSEMSDSVQFWLFFISNILSILCCLFNLFCLVFDRTLRNTLHNHIIIIILLICLIYELIDIPIIIYNHFFDIPWQITSIFYRFWSFIDIGLYNTLLIIFSWATIERYIIVFHNQWLLTEKKRLFLHYLPIILLIIYCFIWYSFIILFPHCLNIDNQLNSNENPYLCMLNNSMIKYFDLICHQVIPSLIIIIFSITLFLRIQWKQTDIDEAKQKQMIFQILSISILYLLFCSPSIFVLICFQVDSLENIGLKLMPYAHFFSYYFIFLLPFVCFTSVSQIHSKLKKLLCK